MTTVQCEKVDGGQIRGRVSPYVHQGSGPSSILQQMADRPRGTLLLPVFGSVTSLCLSFSLYPVVSI